MGGRRSTASWTEVEMVTSRAVAAYEIAVRSRDTDQRQHPPPRPARSAHRLLDRALRSGGRRSAKQQSAGAAIAVLVAMVGLFAGCGPEKAQFDSDSAAPPIPVSSVPTSPTRACTAIGCSSQVVVDLLDLPGDFDQRATVCIDSVCTNPEFVPGAKIGERLPGEPFPDGWTSGGAPFVFGPAPDSHVTTVRITVIDSAGTSTIDEAITAPLTAHQPNGPNCPPTCWYVRVAFDSATSRLTAFDANGRAVASGVAPIGSMHASHP
ncbi:MAG: hypothetical protein AB7W59_26370 [Acidimicrobiia bacterium]